jgi:hypothetical protein
MEEAMAQAEKHASHSEPLAALVLEAEAALHKARAAEAERASAAAKAAAKAAAAKAAAAAERLRIEEEMATLTLRMQTDARRVQEMQAQLGNSVVREDAETMCVVCFDAPKDHAIVPCGHQCVCAGCAEQLTKTRTPSCPVCRGPIERTMRVFCS